MRHLIFHLNILAESAMIRAATRKGIARMLGELYGDEQAWFNAYSQVVFDWDSYHADLNFSGDDSMADMREARFRIMRALFRITGKPEPSQDEIHALADEALTKAHLQGDIFYHESHDFLPSLAEHHSICFVSYFPQAQLEAMIKGSFLQAEIQHFIGADTFEQYEMNRRYFEMLLSRLKAKPEDCFYIDKQLQVLEAASQAGIRTFNVEKYLRPRNWWQDFLDFLAKEIA